MEQRYGSGFLDRVQRMIEDAGFQYAPPPVVPNSFKALQLGELAREHGAFGEVHVKLFQEHWSRGRDISDVGVLTEIARSAGLDDEQVARTFAEGRYREAIAKSTETAAEFGIDGIPAWVIDFQFLILGAQPPAVFEQAMQRLGYKPGDEP